MATVNQEIYEKNTAYLKNKYPVLYQQLQASEDIDFQVEIIDAKDGNLSAVVQNQQRKMYLYSRYVPFKEIEDCYQSLEINEGSMMILFGFGLGYHAQSIIKKMDQKSKLLIIEPSISIFQEVIRFIDVAAILEDERVDFLVGKEEDEYQNRFFKHINWLNVGKVMICDVPVYLKLFPEIYRNFSKKLKEVINFITIQRNTVINLSTKWQNNIMKNTPYMLKSNCIQSMFGLFQKKPAVIVAAGPSLNKNVHLLKEIKEKAVIICVDTALKVLLKEGIQPHLVVTVDGVEDNYKHFEGIDYHDIPLAYSPKCYPDILKNHTGKKILFISDDRYIDTLFKNFGRQIGTIFTGGSVACNAFDIARKMEADPIIFIGQDLAFTGNKTHASGTAFSKNIEDENKELIVEDIYGEKVPTSHALYSFLTWFEMMIQGDSSGRVYIDATEGGAKIKGTNMMTFRETIDQYCQQDIGTTEKLNHILTEEGYFQKDEIDQLIDEYQKTAEELKFMKNKCKKAFELSEELYRIYERNQFKFKNINSILRKLNQFDQYLQEEKEKFQLIHYMLYPIIYKSMMLNNEKEEDEQKEGMRIAMKSVELYREILKSIDYVIPLLSDCIEEMRKLLEE